MFAVSRDKWSKVCSNSLSSCFSFPWTYAGRLVCLFDLDFADILCVYFRGVSLPSRRRLQRVESLLRNSRQSGPSLFFLEKLFPLDWQAYCFMRRQKLSANLGRREINVYLLGA